MDVIVFFPTNNDGKFLRYKTAIEKTGMQYKRFFTKADGSKIKLDVKEDGKTSQENAHKKAKAFYDEYKQYLPNTTFFIMTTDEELFIDGLAPDKQPGKFVRRFGGEDSGRATDDEMIARYTGFVNSMGGIANAKWKYSMTLYDGKEFRDLSWDEAVLFSGTPHTPIAKGYPLNSITIVSQNGDKRVMLSELSPEQQDKHFSKYTTKVAEFIYKGIEADLDEPYIE